jgi:hypothetical protein
VPSVATDIGGLVDGEDHRDRRLDPAGGDRRAVEVERGGATLAEAAAVVGELPSQLVVAGGRRLWTLDREPSHPEQVVEVLGPALV